MNTDVLFARANSSLRGRARKYAQEDFDRMDMMYKEGKSFAEIGLAFGVKAVTIRNKFYEHIGAISNKHPNGTTDKPLRAPDFSGWDFSQC